MVYGLQMVFDGVLISNLQSQISNSRMFAGHRKVYGWWLLAVGVLISNR